MAEVRGKTQAGEWYRDGLRFECTQCGNCCTGPPGYVWFDEDEGRRMAALLKLDYQAFLTQYARRLRGGRWSLREQETEYGFDCTFLDRESVPGKALCSIYQARPAQCKTWPFWPDSLRSKNSWAQTKQRTPCPGMGAGELVPIERIRILRDATPA